LLLRVALPVAAAVFSVGCSVEVPLLLLVLQPVVPPRPLLLLRV
jgi:hypothetical protein